MRIRIHCIKYIIITVLAILVPAVVFPGTLMAREAASGVKTISPPPAYDAAEAAAEIQSRERNYFTLRGFIDDINSNRIVIGDRERRIAPGVDVSGFQKGMYVGLHLNDSKMVTDIRQFTPPKKLKSGR